MNKEELIYKHIKYIAECHQALADNLLYIIENGDSLTEEDFLDSGCYVRTLREQMSTSRQIVAAIGGVSGIYQR